MRKPRSKLNNSKSSLSNASHVLFHHAIFKCCKCMRLLANTSMVPCWPVSLAKKDNLSLPGYVNVIIIMKYKGKMKRLIMEVWH